MTKLTRLIRLLLASILVVPFVLFLAAPAEAATPNFSIVPFMNCYWDNGNGTYTVSIGYNNKNSSSQTRSSSIQVAAVTSWPVRRCGRMPKSSAQRRR